MSSTIGATVRQLSHTGPATVAASATVPTKRLAEQVARQAALPFADGAAAVRELGMRPLAPTGALADALNAGRLLHTGSDEALDAAEQLLRTGAIDRSESVVVGAGINGPLKRVRITATDASSSMLAVEKPAAGQAAQEEFAWKLARAMGIDHYVPTVARRADGTARIAFREGSNLGAANIRDSASLEHAIAEFYLRDASLGLTRTEAAQAARIDRQLLQTFDYLLANNDRHLGNGLFDARSGVLSLIDHGHSGRGALSTNGGTQLEPSLRALQAASGGGRNHLDPVVVNYLKTRLNDDTIRGLHAAVYDAPGIAGPPANTMGASFLHAVRGNDAVEGIVTRLRHVTDTGGYTSRPYRGDNGPLPGFMNDRLDPMNAGAHMGEVRGIGRVRAMFDGIV